MMTKNPWPKGHKGHWWSGWPGAYCMRCGALDPQEVAIAYNWLDPYTGKWDSEEHKRLVIEANKCPADKENSNDTLD